MDTSSVNPVLDEHQYRKDVLQLDSAEAEQARAQQLFDEARTLGLKVPEIEASAPLAASIAAGMVDLSSPVLSSGSSTDRTSFADGSVTPSYEPSSPSPLDQVVSSPSEITIASERAKPGSTRSLASLSTRPTSYCSSESRTVPGAYAYGNNLDGLSVPTNRMSMLSVGSVDKKEKRRSSLKNAIGRIQFRKKRPSSVLLPPHSQVLVAKGDAGIAEHVYIEQKKMPPTSNDVIPRPPTTESLAKLEVPLFDKESLQRSLDDPELSEMLERHRMERNRHMEFQDAALSIVRQRQMAAISERQSDNEVQEKEKLEKNTAAASRLEERQLAIEMEQQREFERAKMNSRTRIKHMEGYFRNNASPPPSPATNAQQSSESMISELNGTPPTRRITQQQKEQLEQQYHAHESMDALHEARIKVLRDRQEMKLSEAIERMEREYDTLCEQNIKNVKTLQAEHRNEETGLIQSLDSKKTELRHRWHLEEAILRHQLEQRNGHVYGPLPIISFNPVNSETDAETRDSAISVSEGSSIAGQKELDLN